MTITKYNHKEQMKQWRLRKKSEGWKELYMLVPEELALELIELRKRFKVDNRHLYEKI